MEQAENLKLKRELWEKNYKEIRAALDKLKKVKYIDMHTTKRERNDTNQCETLVQIPVPNHHIHKQAILSRHILARPSKST